MTAYVKIEATKPPVGQVIVFDKLLNALIAAEEDNELKANQLISKNQEIERLKEERAALS